MAEPRRLPDVLAEKVTAWRHDHYRCAYPAVRELLEHMEQDGYLRAAQLRALETHLYLRCVEGTPHIRALYERLLAPTELRQAFGIPNVDEINDLLGAGGIAGVLDRLMRDPMLAKRNRLDALYETLTLAYPSYILALAMGTGKTMLIGTIIASEFVLAVEYPDAQFIRNALVFAPGKTILESLRQLSAVDYERLLPPRLRTRFLASVKFTYTRDGAPNIPVIPGDASNIIVTNTEKIRIQKPTARSSRFQDPFAAFRKSEHAEEEANARLKTIASLPDLGVFSDEAHHTYGQDMERGLKRVRQTVDYLAANTTVRCVVNTTGTPYYKTQFLRDVVVWYGLQEGIRDGILKEIAGNIHSYKLLNHEVDACIQKILQEFMAQYRDVALPNGARAKIAFYFPGQDALDAERPTIEAALVALGMDPAIVLMNTQNSTEAEVSSFNMLNHPASPHRVILLVNKGTEGWDCPSLFASALLRRITSSNNFVLQAATRCLRQVPGNTVKAAVYLSQDNRYTLENELKETYGSRLIDLDRTVQEQKSAEIIVRKTDIPPLVVRRHVRTVRERVNPQDEYTITKPPVAQRTILRTTLSPQEIAGGARLAQIATEELTLEEVELDAYRAATELAHHLHLDTWELYRRIRDCYGTADVPRWHIPFLRQHIETQLQRYEVCEEEIEEALAILKLGTDSGFEQSQRNGATVYTATIRFPKSKEHLLLRLVDVAEHERGAIGFHYDPYNFDSLPEKHLFVDLLKRYGVDQDNIADIYFTGGLTSRDKTDFAVDYLAEDGTWHAYTPDFLVRLTDGRCIIVEVKAEVERGHPVNGERGRKAMAVRRWQELQPDHIRYEMLFVPHGSDRMDDTTFQRLTKSVASSS